VEKASRSQKSERDGCEPQPDGGGLKTAASGVTGGTFIWRINGCSNLSGMQKQVRKNLEPKAEQELGKIW